MKTKSLVAFLSLAFCCASSAPAQTLEWTRQLGTSVNESGPGVSADGLGNVYITGGTQGTLGETNAGSKDAFVSKYDAGGTLEWARQLGTSDFDVSGAVSADGLGNVYISGYTDGSLEGTSAGGWDAFISKYDASGRFEWTRQLGTSSRDQSWGVSADGLGNVYITGQTSGSLEGTNAGEIDAFISKYDASGTLEWTRQLGTSSNDWSQDVSADGLGNVYITGPTYGSLEGTNAGQDDVFISKYDAGGTLEWTRQFGTSSWDRSRGISVDGLGNVYISGLTGGNLAGTNAGDSDAFLSKFDASGTFEWTRQLGTGSDDRSRGVSADGLGNVYISGWTKGSLEGTNAGDRDAFISKYDASGTLEWTQQLGTSDFDASYAVSADGLGNVYISGRTDGSLEGTSAGGEDAFVAKFSTAVTELTWDSLGDGNWNDSNWLGGEPGSVPDAATGASVESNTVTVALDAYAKSLAVDNGGAVVVDAGSVLTIIDSLTVGNATLAMSPTGAVTAGGAVTFADGSVYACEFAEAGSGLITATGDVSLSTGSTLVIQATGSLGAVGDAAETIIRADEGATIDGTFTNAPAPDEHLGQGVFFGSIDYAGTTTDVHVFQAAAGDIDGNREINNADLQAILAADSFNNGTGYDWTQGDFDGDTDVDNADLQLILASGRFNSGTYAAIIPGTREDGVVDLIVDPASGNVKIDTEVVGINGYVILSEAGIFTGDPADNHGRLQTDDDHEIMGAFLAPGWDITAKVYGVFDLGNVIGTADLGAVDLFDDLTFTYTMGTPPGIFEGGLILVPQPATLVMFLSAALGVLVARRRRLCFSISKSGPDNSLVRAAQPQEVSG